MIYRTPRKDIKTVMGDLNANDRWTKQKERIKTEEAATAGKHNNIKKLYEITERCR